MTKKHIKIVFLLACLLCGLSFGAGLGFAITGLNKNISLFVLSIGETISFLVFALAVVLLLYVGIYAHKKTLNLKAVTPFFAKVSRCKDIHFVTAESRKNQHAKVLVLSYFDPRDGEKGGTFHQAGINSAIEAFFCDRTLYFDAPNRFIFFVLPQEEEVLMDLFVALAKKLKNKDLSLRVLGGISDSDVGRDFPKAYAEAVAALGDCYPVRENLSFVRYEQRRSESPLAGLEPIEMNFVSEAGEQIALYPFGYHDRPIGLSFLGELGMAQDYETASLDLARKQMNERDGKIGIYFAPTSFHSSAIYLSLSAFPEKNRLIVMLPANETEPKLSYAAKKIRRLGCLIGYYGVDADTPISRLDLEGSYLYLEDGFYDEEGSIVKAKKRLFASRNAITLGKRKEEGYVYDKGGARK